MSITDKKFAQPIRVATIKDPTGAGTITVNTSGAITVPNATDTLVGKATTDTLTNKTLSGNTATNLINGAGTFNFNSTGSLTAPNATDTLVARDTTDTLTNKTLTSPKIGEIDTTGGSAAINIDARTLTDSTATDALDWENRRLLDNTGATSLDWNSPGSMTTSADIVPDADDTHTVGATGNFFADMYATNMHASTMNTKSDNSLVLDVDNRQLTDSSETPSIDFQNRTLVTGATTKLDWSGTDLAVNSRKITGLNAATANGDAVRFEQAVLTNGTHAFSGNQSMGNNKLTNLSLGTAAHDSVRYDQVLLADGTNPATGNLDMGGNQINNMADPTSAQDGATKAYVDSVAEGLKPKAAVRAGTTVPGSLASDFEDGDVIDTVTLVTGDRILIKDQGSPEENGIYIVQASGAPTRAPDFDSTTPIDEINGAYTFIQEGSQAGQGWVQTGTVTVIGVDAINFVFFNSSTGIVGGDMITVTGSTISVDLAGTSGLESTNGTDTGQLRIKKDVTTANTIGVTITTDGAGILFDPNSFADSGSETLALAAGVAGAGLTLTSGVLDVVAADNSILVNANSLQVKRNTTAAVGNIIVTATGITADTDGASIETASNKLQLKDTAVTPATYGTTAAKTASFTVDQKGRLTAASEQDIAISAAQVTSGTLAVLRGGTGQSSYTDGQLLIGNTTGNTLTKSTLTAGSGISITNGSGSITIANTATSTGDLPQTSFTGAQSASGANVTGFAFANGSVRSFEALVSVFIDATTDLAEVFTLRGTQRTADWSLNVDSNGDASAVTFDISSSGQVTYSSSTYAGFTSMTIKFRAIVTNV